MEGCSEPRLSRIVPAGSRRRTALDTESTPHRVAPSPEVRNGYARRPNGQGVSTCRHFFSSWRVVAAWMNQCCSASDYPSESEQRGVSVMPPPSERARPASARSRERRLGSLADPSIRYCDRGDINVALDFDARRSPRNGEGTRARGRGLRSSDATVNESAYELQYPSTVALNPSTNSAIECGSGNEFVIAAAQFIHLVAQSADFFVTASNQPHRAIRKARIRKVPDDLRTPRFTE